MPLFLLTLAATAFAQNPETVAIVTAQQAVRAAPDSEANRLSLASLYLKLGQNHNASVTLLEYVTAHSKAPNALRLLALSYLREENYTAAKDYAQRALQFVPRDAPTTQVLGMAQLGLQDSIGAGRSFEQAVKLDPNLVDATFQLGLLYVNQHERLPEAIRLLEKARTLKPDLAGVHTALGAALLESGKPTEAAAALEQAVSLDPASAESFYQLANAYRKLDRTAEADKALAHFSELSRKRAEDRARDMRSRAAYEQGLNLLTNTDQLDQAFNYFEKASHDALAPDASYYRMAQVLYLKGDDTAALKLIREAIRLNALEPEYYFVLARCLQISDKPAALAAIRTAIGLRPGVVDFEELEGELLRK